MSALGLVLVPMFAVSAAIRFQEFGSGQLGKWVDGLVWVLGCLFALVAGVVIVTAARRGRRVGALSAVRQGLRALPLVALLTVATFGLYYQLWKVTSSWWLVIPLLALGFVVLPRLAMAIPVRAFELGDYWSYAGGRLRIASEIGAILLVSALVIIYVSGTLQLPDLFDMLVNAAAVVVIIVGLSAALSRAFVELTEDFSHIDAVISRLEPDRLPR